MVLATDALWFVLIRDIAAPDGLSIHHQPWLPDDELAFAQQPANSLSNYS